MPLTKQTKIIIGLVAIFALVAVGTPFLVLPLLNPGSVDNTVNFKLLRNAGVMIESNGLRIYVDPTDLSQSYNEYPADAILITHPHGDHYQSSVVEMLQKEDTMNVFPKNMTEAINLHDGLGVNPEDQLQIGHIVITAFYLYTFAEFGYPASHPKEANWTSYIIDINGFTLFHAGDSKDIEEYEELTGLIDVALLPLGPGCQTMTGEEVVDAIQVIQPQYFIPIHYAEGANDAFISDYGSMISECEILNLAYYESYEFN